MSGLEQISSPAALVNENIVKENIRKTLSLVAKPELLWPHIKTHKTAEIIKLCIEKGIEHFKCATLAEAELLAKTGAKYILLAQQPVGPKIKILANLALKYPKVQFAAVIDTFSIAKEIIKTDSKIHLFIDLNVGMNRTGVNPEQLETLLLDLNLIPNCNNIQGIHAYDGHVHDSDLNVKAKEAEKAYLIAEVSRKKAEEVLQKKICIVMGGSPPYSIHSKRPELICSPGTFVFWDKNYADANPEQNLGCAFKLLTRVISKPQADLICCDLGHKSIAAENPINKRVYFLDDPDLEPISQSEEHLVLKNKGSKIYGIGDILIGTPHHVCPTVALYDSLHILDSENNFTGKKWAVAARHRI